MVLNQDKITSNRELRLIANTIRQDIVKMIAKAGSGHPAGSLGMTDVFTALYFNFLNIDPLKPSDPKRDYVFLSNGHICAALYATMANRGYFPRDELLTFRQFGSRLQGHLCKGLLPGVESSSGSLGCGTSQAAGVALALKRDMKPNRVICLTSDGEHQEGNIWEAVMFAAKYKLGNLIQIMDRNNIQIDGKTEEVMPLNPLKEKYLAFNWLVIEIEGNDIGQILAALEKAKKIKEKPVIIIANTTPGKKVSFMENNYIWHKKALSRDEEAKALKELLKQRAEIK